MQHMSSGDPHAWKDLRVTDAADWPKSILMMFILSQRQLQPTILFKNIIYWNTYNTTLKENFLKPYNLIFHLKFDIKIFKKAFPCIMH